MKNEEKKEIFLMRKLQDSVAWLNWKRQRGQIYQTGDVTRWNGLMKNI